MFELIKGASIPDTSRLREEYQISDGNLRANVSANNIIKVFDSFLKKMSEDEPLFLFIEAPCNEVDELKLNARQSGNQSTIEKYHNDIYYLDNYDRESLLTLLHSGVGELLINDGLVNFGFGSLDSWIEIGKYKYNVLIGHLHDNPNSYFTDIFDVLDIPRAEEILTAWSIISENNPGTCHNYKCYGKDIHILINQMKDLGLYKAETREE